MSLTLWFYLYFLKKSVSVTVSKYLRITENCRGREKGMKKTELLGGGGDGKAAQIARVVQMVREFLAERPDRGGGAYLVKDSFAESIGGWGDYGLKRLSMLPGIAS